MITIIRYNELKKSCWDNFISCSKNGTFIFQRDFMEYHSDRFNDFSLMIYNDKKLIALLPANIIKNTVYSHQGLSYGGIILKKDTKFKAHILIYQNILSFLEEQKITKFIIKEIPIIYNQQNDEFTVIVNNLKSKILITDIYTYLDTREKLLLNRNRKRALKKAKINDIKIIKNNDFTNFWNQLLIPNLKNRFNTNPVHTLNEILLLKEKFDNEIVFFGAYQNKILKAGAVLFISNDVAHFQYSAGELIERNNGALDLLFYEIIKYFISEKKYISFGSSTGKNINSINEGVLYWKESYGTENVVQRTYLIYPSKRKTLETLLQ